MRTSNEIILEWITYFKKQKLHYENKLATEKGLTEKDMIILMNIIYEYDLRIRTTRMILEDIVKEIEKEE